MEIKNKIKEKMGIKEEVLIEDETIEVVEEVEEVEEVDIEQDITNEEEIEVTQEADVIIEEAKEEMTIQQKKFNKKFDVDKRLKLHLTKKDEDYIKYLKRVIPAVVNKMELGKQYRINDLLIIMDKEESFLRPESKHLKSTDIVGYLILADEKINWENKCSGVGRFTKVRK